MKSNYSITRRGGGGKKERKREKRRKKTNRSLRAVLFAVHFSPGGIASFSYRILILRINDTGKQAGVCFCMGRSMRFPPNRRGARFYAGLLYLFRRYPPTPLSPPAGERRGGEGEGAPPEHAKMYFSRTIRGNRKSSPELFLSLSLSRKRSLLNVILFSTNRCTLPHAPLHHPAELLASIARPHRKRRCYMYFSPFSRPHGNALVNRLNMFQFGRRHYYSSEIQLDERLRARSRSNSIAVSLA